MSTYVIGMYCSFTLELMTLNIQLSFSNFLHDRVSNQTRLFCRAKVAVVFPFGLQNSTAVSPNSRLNQ